MARDTRFEGMTQQRLGDISGTSEGLSFTGKDWRPTTPRIRKLAVTPQFQDAVTQGSTYLKSVLCNAPEHQALALQDRLNVNSILCGMYGIDMDEAEKNRNRYMVSLTGNNMDDKSWIKAFADKFTSYNRGIGRSRLAWKLAQTDDEQESSRLKGLIGQMDMDESTRYKDLSDRGLFSKGIIDSSPVINQSMRTISFALLGQMAGGLALGAVSAVPGGSLSNVGLATDGSLKAIAAKGMMGKAIASYGSSAADATLATSIQAATEMYQVSRGNSAEELMNLTYKDAYGKDVHMDKALVRGFASAAGAVETMLEFMTVTPVMDRLLKGASFTSHELVSASLQSFLKDAGNRGIEEIRTILGESYEEGVQRAANEIFYNIARNISNANNGTDFDYTSALDILKDSWGDFKQALFPMGVVTIGDMALGIGLSYGATARMRSEAGKIFDGGDTVDIDAVNTLGLNPTQKAGDTQPGTSRRYPAINVIEDEDTGFLTPLDKEDAQLVRNLQRDGVSAVNVNYVSSDDSKVASSEDMTEIDNTLALRYGARLATEAKDTLVFPDEPSMKDALEELGPSSYKQEVAGDGYRVRMIDANGRKVELNLTTNKDIDTTDADVGYLPAQKDFPHILSTLSKDQALRYAERKNISEKVSSMLGNVSRSVVDETTDAFIAISEATRIPSSRIADMVSIKFEDEENTDETLRKNAVGNGLEGKDLENFVSAHSKSRGWMNSNDDGSYTIHLTRNADPSTIIHESGHVIRRLADPEQLSEFKRIYGEGSDGVFISDIVSKDGGFQLGNRNYGSYQEAFAKAEANEERFADDFVSYLQTGIAPVQSLQGLFSRMRDFLKSMVGEFGNRLSDDTRHAFDNLFSGDSGDSFSEADYADIALFQQATTEDKDLMDEVKGQYEATEKTLRENMGNFDQEDNHLASNGEKSNLTYRQWVQVRTPAFKEWFGDWLDNPDTASRVVDGNGEPLVVYHGSRQSFDRFDLARLGKASGSVNAMEGFYFVSNKALAARFGTFRKYDDPTGTRAAQNLISQALDSIVDGHTYLRPVWKDGRSYKGVEISGSEMRKDIEDALSSGLPFFADGSSSLSGLVGDVLLRELGDEGYTAVQRRMHRLENLSGSYAQNVYQVFLNIRKDGEDGRILRDVRYDRNIAINGAPDVYNTDMFISKSPSQIKSATDNRGTFDGRDSSILFQEDPSIAQEAMDTVDALSPDDIGVPNVTIRLSDRTPYAFTSLGFPDLPNEMYVDKLARGLFLGPEKSHGHADSINREIAKETLGKFSDPLLVFDSKRGNGELVAVYDVRDLQGNAVMLSLKPDNRINRIDINLVTSMYGKPSDRFDRWISDGYLRYVDDTKKGKSSTVRLQLPSVDNLPYDNKVLHKSSLVKRSLLFQSSPSFARWFRDSKVTDSEGNPLVVYHGSPVSGITVFSNRHRDNHGEGGLYYASSNKEFAEGFSYRQLPSDTGSPVLFKKGRKGSVYSLYASIQHPLDFRALTDDDYRNIHDAATRSGDGAEKSADEVVVEIRGLKERGIENHQLMKVYAKELVADLKSYGYDGLIARTDPQTDTLEYAVIFPSQFKSAVDNVGAFNPEDDNILFQIERNYNPGKFEENKASLEKFDEDISAHDTDRKYIAGEYYAPFAHTPLVFRELGFKDLPCMLFKNKVTQILSEKKIGRGVPHGDAITIGILRQAIRNIPDPVAVFDSVNKDGTKRDGQLVVLTTAEDKKGFPVIVPLHMEEKAGIVDIVQIASVYGKENAITLRKWFEDGLRYIDTTKADALGYAPVRFGESQVPSVSGSNVITKEQIVNKYGLPQGDILFQLSPEDQKKFTQTWHDDVRTAVEQDYYVGDDILAQFAGEEWADREIELRQVISMDPSILDEAREHRTFEDYLGYLREKPDWNDEEGLDWAKRMFDYARIVTPDSKDRQFVMQHLNDNNELLKLSKSLKGYTTPILSHVKKGGQKSYGAQYHWGAFKGVSTKVTRLKPTSSPADFQVAAELIKANPRPYRRAFDFVTSNNITTQEYLSGNFHGENVRDEYYENIGENVSDELARLDTPKDRVNLEEIDNEKRKTPLERLGMTDSDLDPKLAPNLDAELKRLGKESRNLSKKLEKERDKVSELRSQLSLREKELRGKQRRIGRLYADLGLTLSEKAKVEQDAKQFKQYARKNESLQRDHDALSQDLSDKRDKIRELKSKIAELNESVQSHRNLSSTLQAKIDRMRYRQYTIKFLDQISESLKYNQKTMDASYEGAIMFLSRIARQKPINIANIPSAVQQYLPEDVWELVIKETPMRKWDLNQLRMMQDASDQVLRDARMMYSRKESIRQTRRIEMSMDAYKQVTGLTPVDVRAAGPSGIVGDLRYYLDTSLQRYVNGDEGLLAKGWHVVTQSFVQVQRLARFLDRTPDGAFSRLLVHNIYDCYQNEFSQSTRRLQELDEGMKKFGITNSYLAEHLTDYKRSSGNIVPLSREETLGVYIYNQNTHGQDKLAALSGQGMNEFERADIVSKLSENDKRFGDFLIEWIGGDKEFTRQKKIAYDAYNINLARERNYFPLRSKGVEETTADDLIKGPQQKTQSYINHGMLIDRVKAEYPLDLNVLRTARMAMQSQEHMIAFATYISDLNAVMGPQGAVSKLLSIQYGSTTETTVQRYINNIAGSGQKAGELPKLQRYMTDLMNNYSGAAIAYSIPSMMKQLTSAVYSLNGQVSFMNMMKVLSPSCSVPGMSSWKEARAGMYRLAPEMEKRYFSIDAQRFKDAQRYTKGGEIAQKVTQFGIDTLGTGNVDKHLVTRLWWGAYLTGIDRGMSTKDAIYHASQFISETQNSSNPMDLSETQRGKDFWSRSLSIFRQDAFKHYNMVFYDIPFYWRNRMWKRMAGTFTALCLQSCLVMAACGGLVVLASDDDKKKQRQDMAKAIFVQMLSDNLPYVGNEISNQIQGFDGGSLISGVSDFTDTIKRLSSGYYSQNGYDELAWKLIEDGSAVVGLPRNLEKRVVKSIDTNNWWRMMGGTWYKLGED